MLNGRYQGALWLVSLFFQQGEDEGQDVFRHDLVAVGGGVSVVVLHHAVNAVDPFQKEWEQGHLIFFGEQDVGLVELPDVIGPVVGRKGDAGEDDTGTAGFECADDLVEVCARIFNAKAAETVVATELYDHYCRLHGDDAVDALDAIFGGVAADALVGDAIVIAFRVEISLEIVGVAFAGFGAVAGGEAVAEADDQWALVVDRCWRRVWSWKGGSGGGNRSAGVGLFHFFCCVIGPAGEEEERQDR